MRRTFKYKPGDILEYSTYRDNGHNTVAYYVVVRYVDASFKKTKRGKKDHYKIVLVGRGTKSVHNESRQFVDNVTRHSNTVFGFNKTVMWRKVGGYV